MKFELKRVLRVAQMYAWVCMALATLAGVIATVLEHFQIKFGRSYRQSVTFQHFHNFDEVFDFFFNYWVRLASALFIFGVAIVLAIALYAKSKIVFAKYFRKLGDKDEDMFIDNNADEDISSKAE